MHDISELIEYHNENEYLDFKQLEYNQHNQPNLIKDVMAFANANVTGNRYIIIGVKKKDGQIELFNIESLLDSANIQQYIHQNITPELDIEYMPFLYKGHNLMILTIKNPTSQPYMTSKAVSFKTTGTTFLKENECWIRKGSYQVTANRKDFDRMYHNAAKDATQKQVKVSFEDGSQILQAQPKFAKNAHYKKEASISKSISRTNGILGKAFAFTKSGAKTNLSFISFKLRIHNSGLQPIEDYKLVFEFFGEIQNLAKTNKTEHGVIINTIVSSKYIPTTFLAENPMIGKLIPKTQVLVGDDIFLSEEIFLKPHVTAKQITIKWKLISRDHKQNGELLINLEPLIKIVNIADINTENSSEQKEELDVIQDYLA